MNRKCKDMYVMVKRPKTHLTGVTKVEEREFPGGPEVRTPRSHCQGHGFDTWSGN